MWQAGLRIPKELNKQMSTYNMTEGDVVVEGVSIGEIDDITFTITREMAPVYTIGPTNTLPKRRRGARGVAGSIRFKKIDNEVVANAGKFDVQGEIDVLGVELLFGGKPPKPDMIQSGINITFVARSAVRVLGG